MMLSGGVGKPSIYSEKKSPISIRDSPPRASSHRDYMDTYHYQDRAYTYSDPRHASIYPYSGGPLDNITNGTDYRGSMHRSYREEWRRWGDALRRSEYSSDQEERFREGITTHDNYDNYRAHSNSLNAERRHRRSRPDERNVKDEAFSRRRSTSYGENVSRVTRPCSSATRDRRFQRERDNSRSANARRYRSRSPRGRSSSNRSGSSSSEYSPKKTAYSKRSSKEQEKSRENRQHFESIKERSHSPGIRNNTEHEQISSKKCTKTSDNEIKEEMKELQTSERENRKGNKQFNIPEHKQNKRCTVYKKRHFSDNRRIDGEGRKFRYGKDVPEKKRKTSEGKNYEIEHKERTVTTGRTDGTSQEEQTGLLVCTNDRPKTLQTEVQTSQPLSCDQQPISSEALCLSESAEKEPKKIERVEQTFVEPCTFVCGQLEQYEPEKTKILNQTLNKVAEKNELAVVLTNYLFKRKPGTKDAEENHTDVFAVKGLDKAREGFQSSAKEDELNSDRAQKNKLTEQAVECGKENAPEWFNKDGTTEQCQQEDEKCLQTSEQNTSTPDSSILKVDKILCDAEEQSSENIQKVNEFIEICSADTVAAGEKTISSAQKVHQKSSSGTTKECNLETELSAPVCVIQGKKQLGTLTKALKRSHTGKLENDLEGDKEDASCEEKRSIVDESKKDTDEETCNDSSKNSVTVACSTAQDVNIEHKSLFNKNKHRVSLVTDRHVQNTLKALKKTKGRMSAGPGSSMAKSHKTAGKPKTDFISKSNSSEADEKDLKHGECSKTESESNKKETETSENEANTNNAEESQRPKDDSEEMTIHVVSIDVNTDTNLPKPPNNSFDNGCAYSKDECGSKSTTTSNHMKLENSVISESNADHLLDGDIDFDDIQMIDFGQSYISSGPEIENISHNSVEQRASNNMFETSNAENGSVSQTDFLHKTTSKPLIAGNLINGNPNPVLDSYIQHENFMSNEYIKYCDDRLLVNSEGNAMGPSTQRRRFGFSLSKITEEIVESCAESVEARKNLISEPTKQPEQTEKCNDKDEPQDHPGIADEELESSPFKNGCSKKTEILNEKTAWLKKAREQIRKPPFSDKNWGNESFQSESTMINLDAKDKSHRKGKTQKYSDTLKEGGENDFDTKILPGSTEFTKTSKEVNENGFEVFHEKVLNCGRKVSTKAHLIHKRLQVSSKSDPMTLGKCLLCRVCSMYFSPLEFTVHHDEDDVVRQLDHPRCCLNDYTLGNAASEDMKLVFDNFQKCFHDQRNKKKFSPPHTTPLTEVEAVKLEKSTGAQTAPVKELFPALKSDDKPSTPKRRSTKQSQEYSHHVAATPMFSLLTLPLKEAGLPSSPPGTTATTILFEKTNPSEQQTEETYNQQVCSPVLNTSDTTNKASTTFVVTAGNKVSNAKETKMVGLSCSKTDMNDDTKDTRVDTDDTVPTVENPATCSGCPTNTRHISLSNSAGTSSNLTDYSLDAFTSKPFETTAGKFSDPVYVSDSTPAESIKSPASRTVDSVKNSSSESNAIINTCASTSEDSTNTSGDVKVQNKEVSPDERVHPAGEPSSIPTSKRGLVNQKVKDLCELLGIATRNRQVNQFLLGDILRIDAVAGMMKNKQT